MATRQSELIITCNAKGVQSVMNILDQRLQAIKKRMQEINDIGEKGGMNKALEKEFKQLQKEATGINNMTIKAKDSMKKYSEVIKDLSGAKLKDLKKALQEGKAALNNMSARDPGRQKLIDDLRKIQEQMAKLTGATSTFGKMHGSVWQTAVRNITAYVGVFGAFNFIKNKITDVIRGGAELSDQMADIRKVSGLTMSQIEGLTTELAKIDTRTTLSELNRIAYAGAKLGFGEYGAEGLLEFTRAANQVNVALKEDLGDEALTALSKITENMGLVKKMGVEDAMLATGSAMFKLAATSTAAAGPIVEVTKRIVPMAQQAGMATHEILALASSADSLQLMPEVVGTALSKLIGALQTNHNLVEKSFELPAGMVEQWMKQGKTMELILTIFDKMKEKGNMSALGEDFKKLGGEGFRLISVLTAMANHVDRVRTHLETSSKAFREGTAVTEEYNIQQETAMAYLERASNLWRNAMVNPGSSVQVKEMAQDWYEFTKAVMDSSVAMWNIKTTITLLITSLKMLIFLLPALAFAGIARAVIGLGRAFWAWKASVDATTLSIKNLSTAAKLNWITALIGLAFQAASAFISWVSSLTDVEKETIKVGAAVDRAKEKAEQEIGTLSRLKDQIQDTNIAQEDRAKLLSKINTDYDAYLNYLGIELKTVDDLIEHYEALKEVMRQRFAYQEREDYKRDVMGGEEGVRMKRRRAGAKLQQAGAQLGVGIDLDALNTYINSGRRADQTFKDFMGYGKNAKKLDSQSFGLLSGYWIDFINAAREERKTEAKIDAEFANDIGDFDYDKWLRTQVKGDFTEKPDKAALASAGKAAAERKQALRKKLKDVETESQAIIDKVEEFYRLQEATVEAAVADGKKTRKEADMYLRDLKISKNQTLADVRGALTGDLSYTAEEWEAYVKKNLVPMMADQGEWSHELAQEIINTSLTSLHNMLKRFDGINTDGITSTAFLDKISKNRAGNVREINREKAKMTEEVDKMLMQYHYVEQAQKEFHDNLVGLGLSGESYEQYVARMQKEAEEARKNAKALGQNTDDAAWSLELNNLEVTGSGWKSNERKMLDQFRNNGVKPYTINPEDTEQLGRWLKDFMTNYQYDPDVATSFIDNKQSWTAGFPMLDEWVQDIDQNKTKIQKFYFDLINWEDRYYTETKKQADRTTKIFNERWERSEKGHAFSDAYRELDFMGRKEKMVGTDSGDSFGRLAGWTTLRDDPEVAASMLRMEQARQELELMKQISNDKQLIREKEIAMEEAAMAMQETIMASINERIEKLQQWTDPINTFAETIGTAAGEAIRDNASMAEQVEESLKNMVKAYGQSTISIVDELMMQKVKKLLIQRAMAKDTKSTQKEETEIVEEGGEARLNAESVMQTGIFSITQQMGQQILSTKKSQDQQETQLEGEKAKGGVMAGIAEGAAKIIGKLGWWGIPLIAVITALLNGLLNMALGALFGGGSKESASTSNTTQNRKLVSGMLTYDKGNVQRFIGQDGKVYTATEEPQPKDGLVTRPIATTVQGQPALVAENGPEIVIGRETTRAIMMNEPQLIKYLANYQQMGGMASRRLFDSGNVEEVAMQSQQTMLGGMTGEEARALTQALMLFTTQIQKPLRSTINMYGTDGLYEQHKKAQEFMKKYES